MDAKGRISLPARFREQLAAESATTLVITSGFDGSLWCFPPAAWSTLQDKVRAMPRIKQEVRDLVHVLISPAQDCPLDNAGRVLVPPFLRQRADLQSNVVWAGALERIELWNAARWQKRSEEAMARLAEADFAETLAGLGL